MSYQPIKKNKNKTTRRCNKCKETFPFHPDYFRPIGQGLRKTCNSCVPPLTYPRKTPYRCQMEATYQKPLDEDDHKLIRSQWNQQPDEKGDEMPRSQPQHQIPELNEEDYKLIRSQWPVEDQIKDPLQREALTPPPMDSELEWTPMPDLEISKEDHIVTFGLESICNKSNN